MAGTLDQYDVVRVTAVSDPAVLFNAHLYQRALRVGDRATLLDIYTDPPGYEFECCDSEGKTIWLGSFAPDDLVLERVWEAPTK